jgi:hypothetical protein
MQTLIDKGELFVGSYAGIYNGFLQISEDTARLSYVPGSKSANAVDINLTDINAKKLKWTATKNDGGLNWMTLTPTSGFTPIQITIGLNLPVVQGMAIGTYVGTVTITCPAARNSPVTIVVILTIAQCQGLCGDANADASVDVSDAVWVINYVFVGGDPPQPILACGDANGDASVDVSDAVWVINYVFVGGDPPGDCSPGSWGASGGDCCEFP